MSIGMVLFAILLVAMIYVGEWAAKKLAKKYFEKNWGAFNKEECNKKERRIWSYGILTAIAMLIVWVVAYNSGLKTVIKNEYVWSFIFVLLFMPPWLLNAILSASRKYIRERFPEDCSKKS